MSGVGLGLCMKVWVLIYDWGIVMQVWVKACGCGYRHVGAGIGMLVPAYGCRQRKYESVVLLGEWVFHIPNELLEMVPRYVGSQAHVNPSWGRIGGGLVVGRRVRSGVGVACLCDEL